ncbi:hypothetical protein VTN00DRAFT_8673 [Thermoascus crustaceus]|uniref:uncharacterized protein n=1 Tax=Thermoascus crustaceus TaxID=5088 RepID=UPI0037434776
MGPRRRSEFIIFSNIPEDIFLKDIHSSTEKLLSRSFTSYDPVRQILLVKMTTGVHEQSSLGITVTLRDKLVVISRASSASENQLECRMHCLGGGGGEMRPDQSYLPYRLPQGRSDQRPSAVVESGYAELGSKLEADAKWWLIESEGDVRTALVILVDRGRKELTIQKWELADRTEPNRRAQPALMQQVVIFQLEEGQETANVTDAPLTIAFENVFRREARGQGERFRFDGG